MGDQRTEQLLTDAAAEIERLKRGEHADAVEQKRLRDHNERLEGTVAYLESRVKEGGWEQVAKLEAQCDALRVVVEAFLTWEATYKQPAGRSESELVGWLNDARAALDAGEGE